MADIDAIRKKYELLAAVMDERMTRLWAATEAESLGRGGTAAVTDATGILGKRIRAGIRDLRELRRHPPSELPQDQRVRRPGGGRKKLTEKDPTLLRDLESLVEPVTRGDPMSPLRWTCKSVRKLSSELGTMGHKVGGQKVSELLADLGYSLQSPRKKREGTSHPDRDAQFNHINEQASAFQGRGQPVISVDTKKKKAIPYGVYDVGRNEGLVNVGVDHDTAEFAVESILRWWRRMGKQAYPSARELLITADAGGSNGSRSRLWKVELQRLADETGLRLVVAHYPPGTSKWNKIEHRMFCHITQNWRGRSLESLETIVSLIGNTRTAKGLRIKSSLDNRRYDDGLSISDRELARVRLSPHRFHGDWNYSITPN